MKLTGWIKIQPVICPFIGKTAFGVLLKVLLGYTEGSGHLLLPVISFIALLTLDWRIALASLVTVPLSMVFMTLTMIISA